MVCEAYLQQAAAVGAELRPEAYAAGGAVGQRQSGRAEPWPPDRVQPCAQRACCFNTVHENASHFFTAFDKTTLQKIYSEFINS